MQIKDHRKKEIELIEVLDANRKMCIEHFLQLSKEIRDLSELVSSAFGLEGWNIFAVTRKREVADARRMLAYIIRAKKGYSLEHIGEMGIYYQTGPHHCSDCNTSNKKVY